MIVRNLWVQDPHRKEQWQKYVCSKSRIWLNFRVFLPYCSVIELFSAFNCFPYCCNYSYCHYHRHYCSYSYYHHYHCFSSSWFASARWCFACTNTCTYKYEFRFVCLLFHNSSYEFKQTQYLILTRSHKHINAHTQVAEMVRLGITILGERDVKEILKTVLGAIR